MEALNQQKALLELQLEAAARGQAALERALDEERARGEADRERLAFLASRIEHLEHQRTLPRFSSAMASCASMPVMLERMAEYPCEPQGCRGSPSTPALPCVGSLEEPLQADVENARLRQDLRHSRELLARYTEELACIMPGISRMLAEDVDLTESPSGVEEQSRSELHQLYRQPHHALQRSHSAAPGDAQLAQEQPAPKAQQAQDVQEQRQQPRQPQLHPQRKHQQQQPCKRLGGGATSPDPQARSGSLPRTTSNTRLADTTGAWALLTTTGRTRRVASPGFAAPPVGGTRVRAAEPALQPPDRGSPRGSSGGGSNPALSSSTTRLSRPAFSAAAAAPQTGGPPQSPWSAASRRHSP